MTEDSKQLRLQAESLGLKPHHRANAATIQKLIEAHLDKEQETTVRSEADPAPKKADPVKAMTEEEYRKADAADRKANAGRLIRCIITCMNPEKKNWQGEIISVGSAKLGTFKKFVAFNTPDGYHIPKIIYDMIKERECSIFIDGKDGRGHPTKIPKLIKEFNIQVLSPLTPDELSELGKKQALAAGQV